MADKILTILDVPELSASPAQPGSGFHRLYAKTDGKIYSKNSSNTEYDLTATGGGGGGTSTYTTSLTAAPTNGTTLTLARANETFITTTLTNTNSFTIGLATQTAGQVNEYILILKTGASVPTLTQPTNIRWRGQTPLISTNETWIFVYEYVQISATPTWEIHGTAVKIV